MVIEVRHSGLSKHGALEILIPPILASLAVICSLRACSSSSPQVVLHPLHLSKDDIQNYDDF